MQADLHLTTSIGTPNISEITRMASKVKGVLEGSLGNIGTRKTEMALGRITGAANEFQKSLEASNARVIAFGATAGSIFAVRAAFEKLISSTVNVEKSIAEINSLLNIGGRDLASFTTKLFQTANQMGATFEDAAKAAAEFSRQGLSAADTLQRTGSALALARLSGLNLESAVTSLTAAMNSFKKEALSDIEVINRMAAVDAKFAVSTKDLAEGIKRVGSTADDANVSFNETIALITAAQQTTARGGAVIGNSLRTIFSRLQRPKALEELEQLGIQIKDVEGKSLGVIGVLSNLAGAYDGLSSAQKSLVSETVGGIYQLNILKAVLSDLGSGYSAFESAQKSAMDSTGSAQRRINELNQTISGQYIKTLNNLTMAMAAVGKSTIEAPIQGVLKSVNNLSTQVNYRASEEAPGGTAVQGVLKGISNIISGPAMQGFAAIFARLFLRLGGYLAEAQKALSGKHGGGELRLEVEKSMASWLSKQKELMEKINNQEVSVLQVAELYTAELTRQNALLAQQQHFITGASSKAITQFGVKIAPVAHASGFVPNLSVASAEISGAMAGGYQPGRVISSSVMNGGRSQAIIANSNETRSGFGGNEWINPPRNSLAGSRHLANSLTKTGINPYNLQQKRVSSSGFIPNLAPMENISPLARAVYGKGTIKKEEFKKGVRSYYNEQHKAPGANKSKLDEEEAQIYKKMDDIFKLRQGKEMEMFEGDFFKNFDFFAKGVFFKENQAEGASGEQRYEKSVNRMSAIVRHMGMGGALDERAEASLYQSANRENMSSHFNYDDVQRMANLRGKEFFALLAGGGAAAGTDKYPVVFKGDAKKQIPDREVSVPYSFATFQQQGFNEKAQAKYNKVVKELMEEFGVEPPEGPLSPINTHITQGNLFNSMFQKYTDMSGEGNPNANLDIIGDNQHIKKLFGIPPSVHMAGADFKRSLQDKDDRESMAIKILRVIGMMPGGQGDRSINPFSNLGRASGKGRIGILDERHWPGALRANPESFNSAVYAASSMGKPMSSYVGLKSTGKSEAALKMGGKFVNSAADLVNFDEFIFVSSAGGETLARGVPGIALASSGEVVGFSPQESPSQRLREALKAGDRATLMGVTDKQYQMLKGEETMAKMGNIHGERFRMAKSGGFIPGAIGDALAREKSATGRNPILARDSSLITSENVFGLAAIDPRQGTAKNAIRQHRSLGQSISQIRKARTASKGFVPNLAITAMDPIGSSETGSNAFSSITLGLSMVAMQTSEASKGISNFNSWLMRASLTSKLYSENTKKASEAQIWLADYSKKQAKFSEKGDTAGLEAFEKKNKETHDANARLFSTYSEEKQKRAERTMSYGRYAAYGSAMVGGVASKMLEGSSPNASVAVSEAIMGIEQAGQVLMAIPGPVGQVIAAFLGLKGVVEGVRLGMTGIKGLQKEYEQEQNRTQQVSAELGKFTTALSNIESMASDSSVSLETLNKQYRTQSEVLASLFSKSGSRELAQKLASASPSQRKELINQEQERMAKQLDTRQTVLMLRQSASKHSGGAFSSGGMFGGENLIREEEVRQLRDDVTSRIINGLSDEDKTSLSGLAIGKSATSFEKFGEKIAALSGSARSPHSATLISELSRNPTDLASAIPEIMQKLREEAILSSPKVAAARNVAIANNEIAQRNVDQITRRRGNIQSSIINASAVNVGNSMGVRGAMGTSLGFTANQQAQIARLRIEREKEFTGARTIAEKESAAKMQEIKNEAEAKRRELSLSSSQKLAGAFTTDLDKLITSKTEETSLGAAPSFISEEKARLAQLMNRGLSRTFGSKGFEAFQNDSGQLDTAKFKQSVISESGVGTWADQKSLSDMLDAQKTSATIQEISQNYLAEANKIAMEAKDAAIRQEAELKDIKQKLQDQRDINFMGGLKTLTDRATKRENRREFVRGARMLESSNVETRGRGALMLLERQKRLGEGDVEVAGYANGRALFTPGNKKQESAAKLMNLAIDAQVKTLNEEVSREKKRGKGTLAEGMISGNAGKTQAEIREIALKQVRASVKPEASESGNAALKYIENSGKEFALQQMRASESMGKFEVSISSLIGQFNGLGAALQLAKVQLTETKKTGEASVEAAYGEVSGAKPKGIFKPQSSTVGEGAALSLDPNIRAEQLKKNAELQSNGININGWRTGLVSSGGAALLGIGVYKTQKYLSNRKEKNATFKEMFDAHKEKGPSAAFPITPEVRMKGGPQKGFIPGLPLQILSPDPIKVKEAMARRETVRKAMERNEAIRKALANPSLASEAFPTLPSVSRPNPPKYSSVDEQNYRLKNREDIARGKANARQRRLESPLSRGILARYPLLTAAAAIGGASMIGGVVNSMAGEYGGQNLTSQEALGPEAYQKPSAFVQGVKDYAPMAAMMAAPTAIPWAAKGAWSLAKRNPVIAAGTLGVAAGTAINQAGLEDYIQGSKFNEQSSRSSSAYQMMLRNNPQVAEIIQKQKQLTGAKAMESRYASGDMTYAANLRTESGETRAEVNKKAIEALTKELEELRKATVRKVEAPIGSAAAPKFALSIEISLKDAASIPSQINEQVIAPLREQLAKLGADLYNIQEHVGVVPAPPTVDVRIGR